MNREQKQLIELAGEMNEMCKANDIKFVIGFGCAIGVERNREFLPWDDDIDLIITRRELKKLEAFLEENMPDGRALVTNRNYPLYGHSLVRYVNTRSTRLSEFRILDGTPLGQLLEFFVFDPIPNGSEERKEYEKWLWLYTELQASVVVVARAYSPSHAIDEELYFSYLKRAEAEGLQNVLDEIEREHLTFKEEDCDGMACRWGSQLLLIKRDWWNDIEYRDFGGTELPFFRDNIEHLQLRYGYTWNMVPAEGQEHTHRVIVSAETPYTEHIDQIRERARSLDMDTALKKNKQDRLICMFERYRLQKLAAQTERAFLSALLETLDGEGWFDRPFRPEDTGLLRQRFQPFYEVLFRPHYKKWHMPPELTHAMKGKLFLTLLWSDELDECEDFLKLYGEDWEETALYSRICSLLWELQRVRYGRDMRRAEEISAELDSEFGMGRHIAVERIRIRLMAERADRDTLYRETEALKQLTHRDDPEIQKYLGDIYRLSGELNLAKEAYRNASKSRDGMLRLELHDCWRDLPCS